MYDPTPSLFGAEGPEHRTLYYGDCLDWMSQWDSQSVDLIYLDPPFNSDANYNVLFRDHGAGKAQYRAFDDTWVWNAAAEARLGVYEGAGARPARDAVLGLYRILGPSGMLAYLSYMAERLEYCQRLLKPTGSIYLHCDPTASHYLKLVMDGIFGAASFRNEITWQRTIAHNDAKRYGNNTDRLLYYVKGKSDVTWNGRDIAIPKTVQEIKKSYPSRDDQGAFRAENLTAAGIRHGESGQTWKGYDISARGVHWRPPLTGGYARWIEENIIPGYRSIEGVHDRLDALDDAGLIRHPVRGFWPGLKRYAQADTRKPVQALWTDIPGFTNYQKADFLGYPTQKPRALLERIIKASSNEGDMVLDPFCGCGTAVDAANRLGRRWAGIDISSFAIDLIRERRMADQDIAVKGTPYDLRSAKKLASEKPFEFESWAIMRMPGFRPNTVQGGDGGIDGRATLATKPADYKSRLALAQVKGGKFNLSQLRDFMHVTDREKAALGVYVTLDRITSQKARAEAFKARTVTVGAEQYPRCQLWPIADYFDERRPHLPTMTDPYTGKPLAQGEMFA